MADNQRRWRSGSGGGGVSRKVPQPASNRFVGRFFFSLVSIAVLGLIAWVLMPAPKPRSWVIAASTATLDDFAFAVPFADESSTWLSEKFPADRRSVIPSLQSVEQIKQQLDSWRAKGTSHIPPRPADTLVVYLNVSGIEDGVTKEPQIVISAPKDPTITGSADAKSEEAVAEKTSSRNPRDYLVSVKSLLEVLGDQPFQCVLVVFDCSRTLDSRRWGWNYTNTFPNSLGKVLNDLGKSNAQKASKLWVICAADQQQLGLPMAKLHKTQFGWLWHKSLWSAKQKGKNRPLSLLNLYDTLLANPRSDQTPKLYHPEFEGPIDRKDGLARLNTLVWHGDIAPFPPGTDPKSKNAESSDVADTWPKAKDLDELREAAKGKASSRTFEGLGIMSGLSDFHDVWKLCRDLELGTTPVKGLPSGDQGQLLQPTVYAPHLWRSLKWQLVADEYSLLAGVTPPRTAQQYAELLNKLSTYPQSRPSGLSEAVFNRMELAWYEYANSPSRIRTKSSASPEKEKQLIEAHRQYAEALFVFQELVTLENRLNSVTNATPFTHADEVKLADAASMLPQFQQQAFSPSSGRNPKEAVDSLIELGTALKTWEDAALGVWNDFAAELMHPDENKKTARNNSVALDLMLTSILWTREQRQEWRAVQAKLSEYTEPSEWKPGREQIKPNVDGLIKLTETIGLVDVFPFNTTQWPVWYLKLARTAQATARSKGRMDGKAHLMASLCDPRDYAQFTGDEQTWFVPQLRPDATPELLALEEVLVEVPPVASAKGDGKEAVKPTYQTQKVGLDKQSEDAFKFKILWTPSPDRLQDKTLSIKLKASFDESWIVAEKEREVRFEGADDESTDKDGVRVKEVRWPVKMTAGKLRRLEDKSATSPLRISIDMPSMNALNESRAIAAVPSLQVDPAKSRVECQVALRNERAVSLSFRRGDRLIGSRRTGTAFQIHEIPMLANREFSFDWVATNDSPIPVKVKVQLWAVEHSDEWTSPWGRIPIDKMIQNTGGPLRPVRKRPLAEYEFAQLGINENRSKEILWTAQPADAPKVDLTVTAGAYCLITVDDQPNREYWVEFVPREPRRWLDANATITQVTEAQSNFDARIVKQDEQGWPWSDYPNEVTSKLVASLGRPQNEQVLNWSVNGGGVTSIPGSFKAQLTPVSGLNNPALFVDVGGWPRAVRWGLAVEPTNSRQPVIQAESEVYRVSFTELEYFTGDEKVDPTANEILASKVLNSRNGLKSNSRKNPWYLPLPSKESPAKSRITLSWEADTPPRVFSDGALTEGAPELRIERVFGEDNVEKLSGWRADRQWRTTCTRDPENPNRLVFLTSLTDFRRFPLRTQDLLGPTVITLRGQFYSDGTAQPLQTDDQSSNPVYVLFDGTPPTITITNLTYEPKTSKLLVDVEVKDGPTPGAGSGVTEIAGWVRKSSLDVSKLTPAELEMPGDRKVGLAPDNLIHQLQIPLPPDELGKPLVVVARCLDRVGLVGDNERKIEGLPSLPGGGMNRNAKTLPKNGVIEGVLILPKAKKPAEGFVVSLDEVPNVEFKTKSDGRFRFANLDRGAEFTLNVNPRSLNSTNYGISAPRKLKPADPEDSDRKPVTITLEELKKK